MTETFDVPNRVTVAPPVRPLMDHRQFLTNLDNYSDTSSERDTTSDEDVEPEECLDNDAHADSLVGFSISHAQTRMKLPRVPAVLKKQALEESSNYLTAEPESIVGDDDSDDRYHTEAIETISTYQSSAPDNDHNNLPKHFAFEHHRSSISRVLHGDGLHNRRHSTSTSGQSIMGSFRKMLPVHGASHTNSTSRFESQDENTDSSEEQFDPHPPRHARTFSIAETRNTRIKSHGASKLSNLDGDVSSTSINSNHRPRNLRRITSDGSLYLRRTLTSASELDDTTLFASRGDMPNSRFKAITDSLQETSILHPKLPIIGHQTSQVSPNMSDSDLTTMNTEVNTGKPRSLTFSTHSSSPAQIKSVNGSLKNTKHPILHEAMSKATGDIVVMGGYRGSILRSAEPPHHQVWAPVKVGLNLRNVNLEVGLSHEDEKRMEESIFPSGILSHIGPIDISRRLLKKLHGCHNAKTNKLRVQDWGYDWRLSPHLLSRKLIAHLESLESNQPGTRPEKRGALVVAHSLGGLIARHAMNQRPELFSGLIFAGTPQNCCNILGPLRNGDDVLISSKVLTAQVNFTLRTSYALLPEDGRCFLNKDTGERYDIDFFDVKNWEEFHLSPCINPAFAPAAKKKSVVGSISDGVSNFTPTLPTKRLSWFTSNHNSPSTKDGMRGKASRAKDELQDAAQRTGESLQAPIESTEGSLEPSMKPNTHKSSVATAVTIPKDQAWEYLERTLSEVKAFKQELHHRSDHENSNVYPPQAIIFGKIVPTVYGAKVASREAIKYTDAYDDLAFASGDGVVLASAAQLPAGYRCVKNGRVESERGHVGLLGDLEGVGQCINAVIEGRRKGIGLGEVKK